MIAELLNGSGYGARVGLIQLCYDCDGKRLSARSASTKRGGAYARAPCQKPEFPPPRPITDLDIRFPEPGL